MQKALLNRSNLGVKVISLYRPRFVIKTFLGSCINGIAIVPFIFAGLIAWHQAILMAVGSSNYLKECIISHNTKNW